MTTDKTHILITGASRGIGNSILEKLQNRDTHAIGHASKSNGDIIGQDLADINGASALWNAALDRLDGRIDILVNNAGIFEENPLDNSDEAWAASWAKTMQINLTASAELCRYAVHHFQNRKRPGRIINVASRAAYRGDSPAHWHYAASKGGMVAMTKTIARAYAAEDILAFAVCPGFTMTGMADDYLESRGGDKLLADIPLGRVAKPDEVASIVSFLALEAPASMTGAVLDVNGASYVR